MHILDRSMSLIYETTEQDRIPLSYFDWMEDFLREFTNRSLPPCVPWPGG